MATHVQLKAVRVSDVSCVAGGPLSPRLYLHSAQEGQQNLQDQVDLEDVTAAQFKLSDRPDQSHLFRDLIYLFHCGSYWLPVMIFDHLNKTKK